MFKNLPSGKESDESVSEPLFHSLAYGNPPRFCAVCGNALKEVDKPYRVYDVLTGEVKQNRRTEYRECRVKSHDAWISNDGGPWKVLVTTWIA